MLPEYHAYSVGSASISLCDLRLFTTEYPDKSVDKLINQPGKLLRERPAPSVPSISADKSKFKRKSSVSDWKGKRRVRNDPRKLSTRSRPLITCPVLSTAGGQSFAILSVSALSSSGSSLQLQRVVGKEEETGRWSESLTIISCAHAW